jgi:UDP-N-acetylmuramoyl-tripeptide--D-alanyl-D-alanine ligase
MAVIEMGANHQKEIEGYCYYTQPTHGIITNIGKAHLEGFGGEEGVKKGKGELFDYLRTHNGTAFVFSDHAIFHDMVQGISEVVWYGTHDGEIQGTVSAGEPFLQVSLHKGFSLPMNIQSRLVGDYNLPNILCAVAVGRYFGVPEEKIRAAIENYTPSNSRSQLVKDGTNSVVLDAYNANPSSMRLAIENFAKLHAQKKVLMLGGMMELGSSSLQEHKDIVTLIKQYPWDTVVLVGGDFGKFDHGFTYFPDSLTAAQWFREQHFDHTHILIKGSRSMQMERIVE